MVDWNEIAQKWSQFEDFYRQQIIKTMREEQQKDPAKFEQWLRDKPGFATVWSFANPAAAPAPTVKPPVPTPAVPMEKPKPPIPAPAKQMAPSVPITKPTKILTSEDMRLLQDYWNTQFIRALGKVPAGYSSVFRIEFQEIKTLPFADARAAILAAADREIADIEAAQKARAVVRQGERVRPGPVEPARGPARRELPPMGEEEGVRLGNVPPASFPPAPLSIMQPFPRGPTSEEKIQLWRVFCYQMRQAGFNCDDFQRPYDEYIEKSQFLSWEDLRERFEFVLDALIKGERLPPLVQWRARLTTPTGLRGELRELEPSAEAVKLTPQQIEQEEKNVVMRQRILITHWAAALIHQARYYNKEKTLSDLYEEVVKRGIIDASIPLEIFLPIAKEAIREVYGQPLRPTEMMKTDGEEEEVEKLNLAKVPFVGITQQEIDEFLASG